MKTPKTNKQTKFTSGPWKWVGTQRSPQSFCYLTGMKNARVGVCLDGFTDNEADARLIAAAPDLFAIVKDYADNADCGDGGEGDACKRGVCWHCQAVAMVERITGKNLQ